MEDFPTGKIYQKGFFSLLTAGLSLFGSFFYLSYDTKNNFILPNQKTTEANYFLLN